MGVVFGHIEVSAPVDGYRWVRDMRTGEAARVSVDVLSSLAERWFARVF